MVLTPGGAVAADKPVKIVVLGDSLSAGYGLDVQDAFPSKLQAALKAKGYATEMINAGVSGDTATGGLERFDWSVPSDADAVILELGANDALRGVSPDVTRSALDQILSKIDARKLPVLLAGMKSPPNMGPDYVAKFDAMYPELAKKHGAIFYPFFLDGVAADDKLNQRDGMHPNPQGVDVIVKSILPKVEELIGKAKAKAG
ncbi:MAG: arylesterase [Proteobacteria bacterium]|nr:arylesterase [Pseudomonadota bacterium]